MIATRKLHKLTLDALLGLSLVISAVCAHAQDAKAYPHPAPIKITPNGAQTAFLMLGPMPTAGLTINNARGERLCAPGVGEVYRAERWDGWWRLGEAPEGTLDVHRVVTNYVPHAWPPHYPDIIYLHTYLTVTNAIQTHLHIDGVLSDAHVWLDGEPLARSGKQAPLSLTPGTHGLLVKCFGFQDTGMAWNVSCRLLDPQHRPQSGITATHNHPGDAPAELFFRNNTSLRPGEAPSDRIEVRMGALSPTPGVRTYYDSTNVTFSVTLQYLSDLQMLRAYGPADYTTWSGFRGSAELAVYDFWGQNVNTVKINLVIRYQLPSTFHINLGTLDRGHYTMQLILRDEAGRRLMQRTTLARSHTTDGSVPMQFAVISHALNHTAETHSSMATSTDHTSSKTQNEQKILRQSRLMGSRLHMPGNLPFWPTDVPVTNASKATSPQHIWNETTEACLDLSAEIDLPLCADLGIWSPDGETGIKISGTSDHITNNPAQVPLRISLIAQHLQGRVQHWRFHSELNTLPASSSFMRTYSAVLNANVTALRASDPSATLIAPGLTGADTNALHRLKLVESMGPNAFINLHTYSWGYLTEPDLVSGPVREALQGGSTTNPIVISRSGHDRAYPGNGVLGQTQQLPKWFGYALANPDIKKVFFGMQPGERWTPVDAQQGPYPAWVALRTMAGVLDGATLVERRTSSVVSHVYAFTRDTKHYLMLWHDTGSPAQVRAAQDTTYINMMDQRFPVVAATPITIDRLPVILMSDLPIMLRTQGNP